METENIDMMEDGEVDETNEVWMSSEQWLRNATDSQTLNVQ